MVRVFEKAPFYPSLTIVVTGDYNYGLGRAAQGEDSVRVRSTGIREAKARLSELLRDVKRGNAWIITERGIPVAKLVAVAAENLSLIERLRRLEEAGLLESAPRDARPVPPPLPLAKGLARRWLDEDRGV